MSARKVLATARAKSIVEALEQKGSSQYARSCQRFFKCGEGEYAENDIFIGVKMPEIRGVLKDTREDLSLDDALPLIKHSIHEVRMYGVLWLVWYYGKSKSTSDKQAVFDLYRSNFRYVNNWDLVDVSAPKITGKYLWEYKSRKIAKNQVISWCESNCLWTRRIGMLSTFTFIRENWCVPTLECAEILLNNNEPHDLIHKATGWMLREVGKRELATLDRFLGRHASRMPRVMLRYSIEKLPKHKRKKYMIATSNLTCSNSNKKSNLKKRKISD